MFGCLESHFISGSERRRRRRFVCRTVSGRIVIEISAHYCRSNSRVRCRRAGNERAGSRLGLESSKKDGERGERAEVSSFQAAVFGLQAEINGASLPLAAPLHCVTAETGGDGVRCSRYEIRNREKVISHLRNEQLQRLICIQGSGRL